MIKTHIKYIISLICTDTTFLVYSGGTSGVSPCSFTKDIRKSIGIGNSINSLVFLMRWAPKMFQKKQDREKPQKIALVAGNKLYSIEKNYVCGTDRF